MGVLWQIIIIAVPPTPDLRRTHNLQFPSKRIQMPRAAPCAVLITFARVSAIA